ncbi:MAG: hypothetical protein AAF674_05245 [Pseudomonadota bacterium]
MIKTSLTPPQVDQRTVDMYVAKAKRERSQALFQMLQSLFTAPAQRPALQAKKLQGKTSAA